MMNPLSSFTNNFQTPFSQSYQPSNPYQNLLVKKYQQAYLRDEILSSLRSNAMESLTGLSDLSGYTGLGSRSGLDSLSNSGLAGVSAKSGFQNNYYNNIAKSYGMQHQSHVVVSKKKKKSKIISIDKGLYIQGGTQAFGKFTSLKACMKACATAPSCYAGDYNPWLGRCYFHSNVTACNTMSSHSKLTHFKKIPCTITGVPRARLVIGAQLFGAILQKGSTDLPGCLKKCVNAGTGISPTPAMLALPGQGGQLCFGIDYDFATHRFYFQVVNRRRIDVAASALCPEAAGTAVLVPEDLTANPSVIHILVCPADV